MLQRHSNTANFAAALEGASWMAGLAALAGGRAGCVSG